MEQKKIRLSLIFSSIIFAIGVAINSIFNYFSSISLAFVAILTLFMIELFYALSDKAVLKRIIDVLILSGINLLVITTMYCVFEWANKITSDLRDFMDVFTNLLSIISLICLIYSLIRLMSEYLGIRLGFVETILGGSKKPKTTTVVRPRENRQPKEVMNGDLEQKPTLTEKRFEEYTPAQNVVNQPVEPTSEIQSTENTQPTQQANSGAENDISIDN